MPSGGAGSAFGGCCSSTRSLYRSIRRIDSMLLQGLPEGMDGLKNFLDRAMARLTQVYSTTDALDFADQDVAIETYEQLQPSDASLATLVGLSFRLSTMNMVFTSDVMSHPGYIFPADRPFHTATPTDEYFGVALRTSFMDHFTDIYADYCAVKEGRAADRDALIAQSSLESIGLWLSGNPDAALITNADNLIPAEGDLERLFAGRATIFPDGGHMGNMEHRAVAAAIARFFAD
jgi:hypothetical protein